MWSRTRCRRHSGNCHRIAARPDRRPDRKLAPITKGIALLIAGTMMMQTLPVRAQDGPVLAVAVGEPESASYKIGLGVASLLRTAASTKVQAEVHEFLTPKERVLGLLQNFQLAVVPAGDQALQDPLAREKIRAAVGLADGNQVLVKAELDDAVVYQITRTIFENVDFLRLLYDDLGELDPRASVERISIEVHPGAMLYYREQGQVEVEDLAGLVDASDQAFLDPRDFTVYFGFDQATLDPEEVGTIAEACRYASTLPSAELILGGYADTAGPEPYNDGLSLARAQSVAGAIRNDPRFRDALHVISFGERKLAVQTADEVREPKNRRVVITVVPGERHQ
jgi:outer membrane protein OmpA-like peptidoglycan-associated protein